MAVSQQQQQQQHYIKQQLEFIPLPRFNFNLALIYAAAEKYATVLGCALASPLFAWRNHCAIPGYCHLHLLHLQKCRPQSHAYANCICTWCSSSSICTCPDVQVRSRQQPVKLDQCKGKAAHFSPSFSASVCVCLRVCVEMRAKSHTE